MSPKTFEYEMKKFDNKLRLRLAANGQTWLIERKARHGSPCLIKPLERRGIDNWIRDRDGYVHVARVPRSELSHAVLIELRAHDMWAYRGAGYYADMLEANERAEEEAKQKAQSQLIQDLAGEGYDKQMIKQGDIVSNFTSKVGGYEPGSDSHPSA